MTVKELIRALKALNPDQTVVVECETDSYSFHRLSTSRGPDPDLDENGQPIVILRIRPDFETVQLDWE